MKKHVLIFVSLLVVSLSALAQDKINLVIFSEDGDAFYAYVNGIRQNDKPETNVKVTGMSSNISLRIEFENKALPQLKQAGPLEPGFEHTLRIKKNSKNELKLRYFGQTAISNEPAQGVTTIPYHSSENTASNNSSGSAGASNGGGGITTISSTTTTTRTSTGNTNGENVAVNISMGGVGMNMNVSGMDNMVGNMNTTTSTTVTNTSSSSSSSSYNSSSNYDGNNNQSSSNTNASTSKAGCSSAMNSANFAKMKQSVESKPFSDTKMSTAKVATKNACLSVDQVKEICKLFSMDDDKLAYAKFAYDYCVDKANYYTVSEVFAFSTTTDDFNKFLEQ